jgi:outer membrane murein-binding lipoprotein Lpp
VAEGGGARKRLKEIRTEIAALKEKLAALKTERDTLRAKVEAGKSENADKPAT